MINLQQKTIRLEPVILITRPIVSALFLFLCIFKQEILYFSRSFFYTNKGIWNETNI